MSNDDERDEDVAGDGAGVALATRLRDTMAAHAAGVAASDAVWDSIERRGSDRPAERRTGRAVLVAILATAAVLAGFLVVRVSTSSTDAQDVTVATDPEQADPLEGTAPDSWARLLGKVPATAWGAEGSGPYLVDLARARSQAGVEPLPRGASDEDWRAQTTAMFGPDDRGVSGELFLPTPTELRAELGFGHDELDQVVYFNLFQYVAVGRFDPAAIAAAVTADPRWGPQLEARTYRDVTYYRWGDDNRLSGNRTPVRDMGRGGRLVVGDGWVAWSHTDADAEETIDAFLDPARSLAAVEPVRAAADAADAAAMTRLAVFPADSTMTSTAPGRTPSSDLPAIDRPSSWSSATGHDPEVSAMQARIAYATEAQAEANLDAFRTTWASFVTTASSDIVREGKALVATFTAPPGQAVELTARFDGGNPEGQTFGTFIFHFNIRDDGSGDLEPPDLPEPRPTPAELLADGTVSDDEYAVAFWTFAECATDAGSSLGPITRQADGRFRYTTDGAQADACYETHFRDVDIAWQTGG